MKTRMISVVENGKILNSIIMLVAVYMMHMLASFKSSAKVFFHNIAMFPNLSSIWHSYCLVVFLRKTAFLKTVFGKLCQVNLGEAIPRTISSFFEPPLRNIVASSTVDTLENHSGFRFVASCFKVQSHTTLATESSRFLGWLELFSAMLTSFHKTNSNAYRYCDQGVF